MERSWIIAATSVLILVVAGVIVLQGEDEPEIQLNPDCEPTVETVNETYCSSRVDMPYCEMPVGSTTPYVNVEVLDASFSMRIERCFAPGGLTLNGSFSDTSGAAGDFKLTSNTVGDENGWIWWFSPDNQAAVRWDGGYVVDVMATIDEAVA